MKKSIQTILFLMVLLVALMIVPTICKAATTYTVATEDDLKEKISTAEEGDIIKLTAEIKLKDPIEINGKVITIDGDNHTITRDTETWVTGRVSASLITAGGAGTRVTLKNLKLTNSEKYGAQAYNGGYLALDNVTIGGCAYGGVLVNGGILEVIDLTLNKNNDLANNGIEIGKSSSIDTVPKVVMNGKITSTESDNVIYLATNDAMTEFEVENTDESEYKIYASGDKVVIADENNTILFKSNSNPNVEVEAEEYVENMLTITLNLNDKTTELSVVEGQTVTKEDLENAINLETLSLSNYTIAGYYVDSNFETEFDFETPITEDMEIFVKLEKAEEEQKDTTPKTGVEDKIEIVIPMLIVSIIGLSTVLLKKKEF